MHFAILYITLLLLLEVICVNVLSPATLFDVSLLSGVGHSGDLIFQEFDLVALLHTR